LHTAMYLWYIMAMTGKRFRQIRKKLGLSQSQLAKLIEVTVTALARWERGERPISGPVALCMKLLLEKHERGES
jgi:DNA-binding transcriptional regulator YiaG